MYRSYQNENELYHHGVKGMKWGIRRYQNPDGSLTPEAKKRAKKEYKEDNKKAFELGKKATIYGNAAASSMRRTIKIENKASKQYEKDPEGLMKRTQRLRAKWDASSKTTSELVQTYLKNQKAAEDHCNSLIEKYGREAVTSAKYKNVKMPKGEYSPSSMKIMNEKTNTKSDYLLSAGATLTSAGISMMAGLPMYMMYYPESAAQTGARVERAAYASNLDKGKRSDKQ